jgi:hypothetical protein
VLVPSLSAMRVYMWDGIGNLLNALTVYAHLRCAVSSHRFSAAAIFSGPFVACIMHTRYSAGWLFISAVLFIWVAFVCTKVLQGIQPSSFPVHIVQLFKDGGGKSEKGFVHVSSPPNDLTDEELGLLRYVKSIVVDVGRGQWGDIWSMTGGESKPTQLGFTSIRYHLAFTGYASCLAYSRTPAYTGRLRAILDGLIEHLLDERVWGYARFYWPHVEDPFLCDENIMWTGHVLHLCAMYEAQVRDSLTASHQYWARCAHGSSA